MSEEAATGAAAPTAGQLLKAARERQGMHISVLAASLKVSRRKLELIEADRHEELPDATFVRALASSMCRALKIDAAEVLQALPEAPARRLEPSPGLNRPFNERESAGWGEGWEWSRRLSLPLVAAVLLVGGAVALYVAPIDLVSDGLMTSRGAGKPGPADPAASSARAATAETVPAFPPGDGVVPPAASVTSLPASAASASLTAAPAAASAALASTTAPATTAAAGPNSAGAPPASAPAARAPEATPARAAAPAGPASAPAGLLGLRATDASWVEVRDAQGQVLLSRLLSAGESTSLDGALPLRVTVGNVAGTRITFRGQPVALDAAARENVARLELK